MPGPVTLFGSGETSLTGGRIFDALARQVTGPLCISVLETPAGFELNADRVAGRISSFLAVRLQNLDPRIHQIPARKKGTPFSPESPELVAPIYKSNLIFLGPGSPSYTVRQLQNSLAWDVLTARHRMGASLVFASAAAIASGSPALPVYEIFKVGEDPHWKPGLDFFRPFGLDLVIIPHWNNQDGGEELDTSRCFVGRERFDELRQSLPAGKTVLGIDELTAVTINYEDASCQVAGMGSVHVLRCSQQQDYPGGSDFPLYALGDYRPLADPKTGLPGEVWQRAEEVQQAQLSALVDQAGTEIPAEVHEMVEARELARSQQDWQQADRLRLRIEALGWKITDLPDGPQVWQTH